MQGQAEPESEPLAMSVPEAARRSGLGTRSMWAHVKNGRLRTIRVGTRVLVEMDALREFLANASPDWKLTQEKSSQEQPSPKYGQVRRRRAS
jgi:excisionase family DNA binding protein